MYHRDKWKRIKAKAATSQHIGEHRKYKNSVEGSMLKPEMLLYDEQVTK